jgi:hypothetical protein
LELGYRLNYEAVINYAGNSFCKDSWKMITESNPFHLHREGGGSQGLRKLAGFFDQKITIMGGTAK